MIETIDINDSRAIRNKNNVLGFYDLVINQKKSGDWTCSVSNSSALTRTTQQSTT